MLNSKLIVTLCFAGIFASCSKVESKDNPFCARNISSLAEAASAGHASLTVTVNAHHGSTLAFSECPDRTFRVGAISGPVAEKFWASALRGGGVGRVYEVEARARLSRIDQPSGAIVVDVEDIVNFSEKNSPTPW